MRLIFHKYQGTGNDFVILDNRDGSYNALTQEQIQLICNRRLGIGGDGLMKLEWADGFDFRMVYYNADGREGSMCGNGGRCLVQFAKDIGINKKNYHFIAVDGPHDASMENGLIHLKMQDVDQLENRGNVKILNTGSPHYVQQMQDVNSLDVVREGRLIRYNEEFSSQGINVNFVSKTAEGIRVRTYERGVEDETLSCGTGVTAACLASSTENGIQETKVKVEGGVLSVRFNRITEQQFEDIWLMGPATFVFKGEYEIKN